jgi:putative ABC transport system permease protein
MHSWFQDAQFSFRLIRKHPVMSLLILAALVLGIGVNSAVFSVVNSVLLRPVSLSEPDRVAFIFGKSQQSPFLTPSYPEIQDWKAQSHTLARIAGFTYLFPNIKGNGPPEPLKGVGVTASMFATLGISPAMGRDFTEADDRPGAASYNHPGARNAKAQSRQTASGS